MLATRPGFRGVHASGDVSKDRPRNFCEQVLHPVKPPRPETLPNNVLVVQSDPPTVDIDDVEEFLVHDPLFVEFFNAFLSLPAFPEPVCFNVDTGGFEVVSDGRQRLAKQIKEAVRSQNFTPKIYRLARKHAFSDMPLIPIEDTEGPEGVKIDTTYNVTVLNKDQGIYWIKAERLPIFLESEFYFQYRLAKVISQARLFNEEKDFVVMKIDFTPRQKKVKKSVEVPPPNLEDVIVKQMFVSFGDVKGAAKESWFTQAKEGISTNPKFTTLTPIASSEVTKDNTSEHEQKTRPKSSVFRSPYFGVYAPGLVGPGETEPPINDDDVLNNDMFRKVEDRPFTPRPADKIHRSTRSVRKTVNNGVEDVEQMLKPGSLVYVLPKQDNTGTDSDSAIGETDVKDDEELEKRMNMQPIIDDIYQDVSWDVAPSIALNSVNEFGSVIVGAVMKKTLADVLSVSESVILQDPEISEIYPKEELTCITVNDLDKCYVYRKDDSDEEKPDAKKHVSDMVKQRGYQQVIKEAEEPSVLVPSLQSKNRHARWNREIKKSAEEESDADSLLDSDEDFEEQDIHFRRKKDKWYNLTSMKGIMNFKKFLSGTPGEKYWELWMDIDKGRLIHDEEEEINYSMYMRGKYHKQGSHFELSKEDKIKLGLESPSSWHQEHLFQIQGKVMEPLVLYWAPRYLLKHLLQTDPDKYYMYSAMKSFQPQKESHPEPMTKSLIPLRPKSCCPRTKRGQGIEEMSALKNRINQFKSNEVELITSPKVGNRRNYGDDTIKRLADTPTAKYLGIQPPAEPKQATPKTGTSSRPPTANSHRSSTGTSNLQFSRKASISRSNTPESNMERKSSTKVVKRSSTADVGSFVGKLPGISSKLKSSMSAGRVRAHRNESEMLERCRCKSAVGATTTPTVNTKPSLNLEDFATRVSIVSPTGVTVPCSARNLKGILGEDYVEQTASGEILGPVKKPRDLLSPKLRILDTKQQRSRHASAVNRTESKEFEKVTFYREDSMDSSKVCDSRPTSGSRHGGVDMSKILDMTDCAFMGSERMEMLLQALHHDKEAGRAFRKFMEKDEENQVGLNCFEFWDSVQEYRKLFYKDKLDLFFINKQARVIFAQFIVNGSPKSIEVSDSIELNVMERLRPAYEDLYDEAEEHALKILFAEFLEFLSQDVKTYCKVERSEISRRLETKNTYILNLQKKGIIKERPLTPDGTLDNYVDPVYDESILEKIPPEFRDWTFEKLVNNRLELENFRQYLAENYAEIDLKCWVDIEAWRRTPPNDSKKRDQKARDIKKLYLNKKYFFGPSSPAGKEGQNKVMEAAGGWGKFLEDKPHHDAILAAQKYVAERLEKKHLPMFLASKAFQERQDPKVSSEDIADDISVQKKKRSQAVLKVVRSQGFELFLKLANKLTTEVDDDKESGDIMKRHAKEKRMSARTKVSRTSAGSSKVCESIPEEDHSELDFLDEEEFSFETETNPSVPDYSKISDGAKETENIQSKVELRHSKIKRTTIATDSATQIKKAPNESQSAAKIKKSLLISDSGAPAEVIPRAETPKGTGEESKKDSTSTKHKDLKKTDSSSKAKSTSKTPPVTDEGDLKGKSNASAALSKGKDSKKGTSSKAKLTSKALPTTDDSKPKGSTVSISYKAPGKISVPSVDSTDDERNSLLESKWKNSAKEILTFKMAIKNPVTRRQFQRYIALQGEFMENDLLFWLEVQRYKEMHHLHIEDVILQSKINAIIQCFIDSSIPPSLQIDIPADMAERILDHKHEKGPYLFRESQLAVFRILLTQWIPFCEFRNNMDNEEKVMKTLDRHRQIAQQKEKKYQEELEKERLRREEVEIPELPDELKEEEDDKGKISFSYSNYLSQEITSHPVGVDEDGTQTIRGIPEYPDQHYTERPGYEDDPLVDIRAKEYGIEDAKIYKEYLRQEKELEDTSAYLEDVAASSVEADNLEAVIPDTNTETTEDS